MSKRNGDRARYQKNRKRQVLLRQRVRELVKALRAETPAPPAEQKAG